MCNYLCVSFCPSVRPMAFVYDCSLACSFLHPTLVPLPFIIWSWSKFLQYSEEEGEKTNNPTKYICVFSPYLYLVDTRTLFVFPCRRCFSSVLSFSLRNDYCCKTHASSHTTSEEFAISSSSYSLLK